MAVDTPLASWRRSSGVRRVHVGLAALVVGIVVFFVPTPATAQTVDISPVLECVTVNGDGTFTAVFGYLNRTPGLLEVPIGGQNRLNGSGAGQPPTSFQPGRHVAVWTATSQGPGTLVWKLGNRTTTAGPGSSPCSTNPAMSEAPIVLLLAAIPALIAGGWLTVQRRRGTARV